MTKSREKYLNREGNLILTIKIQETHSVDTYNKHDIKQMSNTDNTRRSTAMALIYSVGLTRPDCKYILRYKRFEYIINIIIII